MASTLFDSAQARKEADGVDQALAQIRNAAMTIRAAAQAIADVRSGWDASVKALTLKATVADVAELDKRTAKVAAFKAAADAYLG